MDCAVTKPILLPRALAARKVCPRCRYVKEINRRGEPSFIFCEYSKLLSKYKIFLQPIFIRSSRIFDLTRTTMLLALPRTEIEEDHSEEDQCEVDGFAAEVLFLEDKGGEEETDYDAAAADHGDDGNHRAGH